MIASTPSRLLGFPLFLAALMVAASVSAWLARPSARAPETAPQASLRAMVPRSFGDWREAPASGVQVVNPQTQALLDRLYSEVLARVYVNSDGYRVMLSLAYGSDQRGALQAHKPEVCYPAQGFTVHENRPALIATRFGGIAGRHLVTSLGARREPVTYWFTVGDRAVQGTLQKRLVDLRFGLSGRVPDGMLFRVSSIDADSAQAHRLHGEFVDSLLHHVPAAVRTRLAGLEAE